MNPSDYPSDTAKTAFRDVWPGGYVEDFSAYPAGAEQQVTGVLRRFADPGATCLEIGPGGGLWTTKYLTNLFRYVICIDVIEKPAALALTNVIYVEAADRDYSCHEVPDNSIDFAFSFGVFCHLSEAACRAYLASLHRVLRPGASAVVMFANWQRHPAKDPSQKRYANIRQGDSACCWFYCDQAMAREMANSAGFVGFEDSLPEFRDTLAIMKKATPPGEMYYSLPFVVSEGDRIDCMGIIEKMLRE